MKTLPRPPRRAISSAILSPRTSRKKISAHPHALSTGAEWLLAARGLAGNHGAQPRVGAGGEKNFGRKLVRCRTVSGRIHRLTRHRVAAASFFNCACSSIGMSFKVMLAIPRNHYGTTLVLTAAHSIIFRRSDAADWECAIGVRQHATNFGIWNYSRIENGLSSRLARRMPKLPPRR